MENSVNKKTEKKLSPRSLLKTGLTLAGGSILVSVAGAQNIKLVNGIVKG